MIFQQWQAVLDGTKTQTRRLVGPHDIPFHRHPAEPIWAVGSIWRPNRDKDTRIKFQVGNTYAVQPGWGKKAVYWRKVGNEIQTNYNQDCPPSMLGKKPSNFDGWQPLRIRMTAISRERLQDISEADMRAEGLEGLDTLAVKRLNFTLLWDSVHTKPGARWQDNPEVWVLEFELAKGPVSLEAAVNLAQTTRLIMKAELKAKRHMPINRIA